MQTGKTLIPFGLTMTVALVLSTYLVTDAMRDIRMSHQIIKVRGYAETPVRSDLAQWNIAVKSSNRNIAEAYRTLAEHRTSVLEFIRSNGLQDADVQIGSVSVSEQRKRSEKGQLTNEIESYELSQTVNINHTNVNSVAKASPQIQKLLGQGVELHAGAPMYFYTRVNELKSHLLTEATKDARERAKTLAEGSGTKLGPLRAARQGAFSVRASDATGISEYASEDTSSIGKKVAAVVTVDYAMK